MRYVLAVSFNQHLCHSGHWGIGALPCSSQKLEGAWHATARQTFLARWQSFLLSRAPWVSQYEELHLHIVQRKGTLPAHFLNHLQASWVCFYLSKNFSPLKIIRTTTLMCKTLVTLSYPPRSLSYGERVQLPLLSVRKRLMSHHAFISSSLCQKKYAELTELKQQQQHPLPKQQFLLLS